MSLAGCGSAQKASYYYTQKQIERSDTSFDERIRVNEYINAFSQSDLPAPKVGNDLSVSVDPFLSHSSQKGLTNLVQIAIKSRGPTQSEKKAAFGICFVVDISGSMYSDNKLVDTRNALKAAIQELDAGTELAIVSFSSDSRTEFEPTIIDRSSRHRAIEVVENMNPEGGTDIESGLLRGYKEMTKFKNTSARLILITDGRSTVGVSTPADLARVSNSKYVEGFRISTIGIGHDVEEKVLRTIAEKGNGAYYFADNAKTLTQFLREDLKSLMIPVAKNVQLSIKAASGMKLKTIYGYESFVQGNEAAIPVGEMNVDDWRVLIAEVEGDSGLSTRSPLIKAELTYQSTASGVSRPRTLSGQPSSKTEKRSNALNKAVVKNAVVFADAMALIQSSKLAKESKFKEASQILEVQIANINVASSLDDSGELAKEAATLRAAKSIFDSRWNGSPVLHGSDSPPVVSKDLIQWVKTGVDVAVKVAPGPWSVIAALFGAVFVK